MKTMYRTGIDSPLGRLILESDGEALTRILLPDEPRPADDDSARPGRPAVFRAAIAQLDAYFSGRRDSFDVPLAPRGTPFQQNVWRLLQEIPFGETVSYAELARQVGNQKACRAVGAANGRNPLPIMIPCHRVIGSDGRLTGYAGGLTAKRMLLELEGALSRPR